MGINDIAFPNLNIYLHNVPQSFKLFGLEIALYGVCIALGVVAGFTVALKLFKKEKMDTELLWDFIIWALVFSVAGARIFYVIFSWDMYKNDLLSIFNLREGGLAIYGGVIAAFTTCYVFTRIKKVSFTKFLDVCVPGLITGQIVGRWGNFFNREVFGEYTNSLLAMRLPVESVRARDISDTQLVESIKAGGNYIQAMPTFLYEGLLNLVVLAFMLLYRKHKKFNGEIGLIYMGGYGIVRFFVEGIRTDRLTIGNTNIAISQVIGIVMLLFAVCADVVVRVKMKTAKIVAENLSEEEEPEEESTEAEAEDEVEEQDEKETEE